MHCLHWMARCCLYNLFPRFSCPLDQVFFIIRQEFSRFSSINFISHTQTFFQHVQFYSFPPTKSLDSITVITAFVLLASEQKKKKPSKKKTKNPFFTQSHSTKLFFLSFQLVCIDGKNNISINLQPFRICFYAGQQQRTLEYTPV